MQNKYIVENSFVIIRKLILIGYLLSLFLRASTSSAPICYNSSLRWVLFHYVHFIDKETKAWGFKEFSQGQTA